MSETKEKILVTALRLFARDGYEAVSVSSIASELGMTKGALYKHYTNKRDIFDSIVERMYQIDAEQSRKYEMPEDIYENQPDAYEHLSMKNIRDFMMGQFAFWTEDAFASAFRKMLTLEQYRSAEMAEMYSNCLTAGPMAFLEDVFKEMMEEGILVQSEPDQLAMEFYAPLYLAINMSDGITDKNESMKLLECHIDRFIQSNTSNNQS